MPGTKKAMRPDMPKATTKGRMTPKATKEGLNKRAFAPESRLVSVFQIRPA